MVGKLFAIAFGNDGDFVVLGVVVSRTGLAAPDSADHVGSCSAGSFGDRAVHGDDRVWFGDADCELGVLGTAAGGCESIFVAR